MGVVDKKYLKYKDLLGQIQCPMCQQWFDKRGFRIHYKSCVERGGDWSDRNNRTKQYFCKFCGDEWPGKEAKSAHQMKCELNPKREETIEKIRESHKELPHSEETKQKIREGMLRYWSVVKKIGDDYVGKEKIKNKMKKESTIDLVFSDDM